MSGFKRARGLGDLGSSLLDQLRAAGLDIKNGDNLQYDTNIVCNVGNDLGVVQGAFAHGRYAKFSESRTQPILGNTDDYTVALIRGAVTTNNIPLFCPKPSALITENGVQKWEITAQPGIALTWVGPVFQAGTNQFGTQAAITEKDFVGWPNRGFIPYYTSRSTAGVAEPKTYGIIDCSTVGSSLTCTSIIPRLNNLFIAEGLTCRVAFSTNSNVLHLSPQSFTFSNTSATITVHFDFSLPPVFASNLANVNVPQSRLKAGILQACKVLGFAPNTVFTIPAAQAANAAGSFPPRPYQMGWRSTMNLYSYKTVRWVPEDPAVTSSIPSANDVAEGSNGQSPTYFDCFTYEHFLQQCINPTFRRCIIDQFDTDIQGGFQKLSLQTQLYFACDRNCSTTNYDAQKEYSTIGEAVSYQGRAYVYVALDQNGNTIKGQAGTTPGVNPGSWLDIGDAIRSTYDSSIGTYYFNDAVTMTLPNNTSFTYVVNTTSTKSPPPGADWALIGSLTADPTATTVTPNLPAIGTNAPYITFNSLTSLFTLNLDSYGFGGTLSTNVDDGTGGVNDENYDTQNTTIEFYNSALNDQARDSWGATGLPFTHAVVAGPPPVPAYTIGRKPGQLTYDERMVIEADDYFHQLFGNWPALRLNYLDPVSRINTSYVRYLPQVNNSGLTVSSPLPQFTPTVVSGTGYLPYLRLAGNTPYFYTTAQDYPSIGNMWNPVDTIVVITSEIPIVMDQLSPLFLLTDKPTKEKPNGNSLKVLAEFVVKPTSDFGRQYRNEIIFEPNTPVRKALQSSVPFTTFDYVICMRMKGSNYLRVVNLSNGGSAFMRFEFQLK